MKTLSVLAVLAAGFAVEATAIQYNAASDGITAPAGVTFTPSGGGLALKIHASGVTGLGIDAGTYGEIDVGESILVSFASPQVVSMLRVAFLYDGPEFGDPMEIAKITVGTSTYRLQATGTTAASWDGFGSVVNLSAAADGFDGLWERLRVPLDLRRSAASFWRLRHPRAGPVAITPITA